VRAHNAVDAKIERLLGLELRLLDPVGRNAHHRRHRRRDRCGLGDLAAIEHVLQAVAQCPDVPRIMFHLENDAVILGRRHCESGLGIGLTKRSERRLARFEGADHAVQTGNVSHAYPLRWICPILPECNPGLTMVASGS
jgi:hypothetical protein